MFTGQHIVAVLRELGVTHWVWLPDSELGEWEAALTAEPSLRVIRVCREGEAWAIAAGLHLGGARPIVAIQCTGLFESGDALRNVCFDLGLPLFAVIGYRSYLAQDKLPGDTALKFTEPVLVAWGMPYRLLTRAEQLHEFAEHYRQCQQAQTPGVVLLAEGKL